MSNLGKIINDDTLNALTKDAMGGGLAGVDSLNKTINWFWDRRSELEETLSYKGFIELVASRMWSQASGLEYVGKSESERIYWVYSIQEQLNLIP